MTVRTLGLLVAAGMALILQHLCCSPEWWPLKPGDWERHPPSVLHGGDCFERVELQAAIVDVVLGKESLDSLLARQPKCPFHRCQDPFAQHVDSNPVGLQPARCDVEANLSTCAYQSSFPFGPFWMVSFRMARRSDDNAS